MGARPVPGSEVTARPRVDLVGADEVTDVVSALVAAFSDYPVMHFILGTDGDYRERLTRLVAFFVQARLLRREVIFGVGEPGRRQGAALVAFPDDRRPAPHELSVLRHETWDALGPASHVRYESFAAATAPFAVETPHVNLNLIGVRPEAAGRGYGRALLAAVHDLSASRVDSEGVSLTTEAPSNVALYEHFGYEVLGRAAIVPDLSTWAMYRRDR